MRFLLALLLAAAPALARAPSIPAADAPQLATLGPDAVGLAKTAVTVPGTARTLAVWAWYPAAAQPGATPETYRRHLEPAGAPLDITTEGIAVAGAAPLAGRFPLVVLSHGFGGWAGGMTYLAENLASKGYVVVAIDHTDGQGGSSGPNGRLRVAGSIVNRARDQQAVIAHFTASGRDHAAVIGAHIDPASIAVVGYSMGGFGVLATGGAPYDAGGGAVAPLHGALDDETMHRTIPGLKAIVAIAPWGGQQPYRAWSEAGLKQLAVPSLWIDGDRDDVSDYAGGVRWLYDHASASNRWLLTYHEARHNVGGNPPPPETLARPDLAENFAEPVWRSDRIAAINQHFITAFLDRFLKGDAAHGAFLDVPTVASDAATWQGEGHYAGAAQPGYWPGFQRRWLLGLELRHDLRSAGPIAAPGACPKSARPDEVVVC